MRDLTAAYVSDPRTAQLAAAVAGDHELVLGAVVGGLAPVLVAALAADGCAPRMIVTADPQALADDLNELGVRTAVLAELERFDHDDNEFGDVTGQAKRAAALEAFATGSWLIANPVAADQPVPDLALLARESLVLKPHDRLEPHALIERLMAAGYRLAVSVEGRGQVAHRGGIVDVFPFIGADALRLDFFGDELDALRRFDPTTQESIGPVNEAVLAKGNGGLATKPLWPQLPPGPIVVVADLPLRSRLRHDHGRREIRLARQSEPGAYDGAGTSVERLRGDLPRGLSELAAMAAAAPGLIRLFARNDEAARELAAHARDAGISNLTVAVGRLSAGFRDGETGLIVVHDHELAARLAVRRRSNRVGGGTPLASWDELKAGDCVVHLRHGIARFRGVATLEKRGFMEDYLLLEFANESKLYVPVESIDQVQRYVGAGSTSPELSVLGGAQWAKKRARVQKAIAEMSGELLATQAARLALGGWACPPDSPAVRRFEAGFPFEETEDQLAAVREIKSDLERPVAMDRLLCGDVGFGKTEVAMRAAFKVAISGRQVAVLAPTTLLAEQHLETFRARMEPAGVRVAGLSRFRTAKERATLAADLVAGRVDVVVGTHAVLSPEIRFPTLGLVIIDEEHRFGVKQKEKLKSSVPGVHVLTLSATPIPRTLHFSLLGLRDISVLAEAPAERLAVETRVAPWDDETVRHAIDRELDRGGQMFVIHHRIDDLDHIAYKLTTLVPRLRIDAVHGRMDEHRIASAMERFRGKQLDCLLATSIIESGIDIPNANTLIITDASHFGLAELHQIRGRIGRFTRQAYAFFLVPAKRDIGTAARERLAAIQDYAELGAGFKLAMRDLELRGAGNLLGASQSGQIDAVGYELYTSMVAEAVAAAKVQAGAAAGASAASSSAMTSPTTTAAAAVPATPPPPLAALLGLQIDAYIPEDWLENASLRLDLHQRIDRARRLNDVQLVAVLARDRYGTPPTPVRRLLILKALKLRLPALGIKQVEFNQRTIRLHLAGAIPAAIANAKLPELVHVQFDTAAGKPVAVLFLRQAPTADEALRLLATITALDISALG